jgi:hypothetical protein
MSQDAIMSVFDFDVTEMSVLNQESSTIEQFNPKPDGGKQYIVQVRLLPNIKNAQQSIVFKKYYWLNDGQDFGYDSPSTLNEFCPVSSQYWSLINSKDPVNEQIAKNKMSIQKRYTAFVQVVKDGQNSNLEGKILPWRIPVPVYKQIASWLKPSAEELAAGKTSKPLFNVFDGFNLMLTVENKLVNGITMREYKVELADSKTPVMVGGQPVTNTPEGQKLFLDYFNEQQPDLDIVSEFGYKEADDNLKRRVKSFLVNSCKSDGNFWPELSVNAAPQTSAPSIVDNSQPSEPAQAAKPLADQPSAPATASQAAPAEQQVQAQGNAGDNIDDILNEIKG